MAKAESGFREGFFSRVQEKRGETEGRRRGLARQRNLELARGGLKTLSDFPAEGQLAVSHEEILAEKEAARGMAEVGPWMEVLYQCVPEARTRNRALITANR
jgi:hypothetical protein